MITTKRYQSALLGIINHQIHKALWEKLPQHRWAEYVMNRTGRDFKRFCLFWARHMVAISDKMSDIEFFEVFYFYTDAYMYAQGELISIKVRKERGDFEKNKNGWMNATQRMRKLTTVFWNDNKSPIDPVNEILTIMGIRKSSDNTTKSRFFEEESEDFNLWGLLWAGKSTQPYYDSYGKDWSKKLI